MVLYIIFIFLLAALYVFVSKNFSTDLAKFWLEAKGNWLLGTGKRLIWKIEGQGVK
jgi:hypothetical protein